MKIRNVLVFAFSATVLAGCGGHNMTDLHSFVKNAYVNRKPKVESIPSIKPAPTFAYAASGLPDPFSPENLKPVSLEKGLRPDLSRRKGPLEQYPLDSLKMVGTISRGKQIWAIVIAPDGTAHRVRVGTHIGQNYGLVTRITEDKVRITELIQGPTGQWVQREASLALAE
ncbi:MAG: pilus assembly protein PilP [Acidiferrobacterales bacterium]